ncbi:MAG: Hpt domain-containing protein [Bacteroidetes bacterium]|nr:Hpt domain-containing protein [Bacteroidota bacterium]
MQHLSNKVTDLSYLIAISKGNKAFIDEMIDIFLSENPLEIELLESAIEEQDYTSIKAYAHKMKSTIPFVGLDKLIEKDLEEIEKLALQKKQLETITQLFAEIKKTCLLAAQELSAT